MDPRDQIIKKQEQLIDMILYDPGNDVRIPLDVKIKIALAEIEEIKSKLSKK